MALAPAWCPSIHFISFYSFWIISTSLSWSCDVLCFTFVCCVFIQSRDFALNCVSFEYMHLIKMKEYTFKWSDLCIEYVCVFALFMQLGCTWIGRTTSTNNHRFCWMMIVVNIIWIVDRRKQGSRKTSSVFCSSSNWNVNVITFNRRWYGRMREHVDDTRWID